MPAHRLRQGVTHRSSYGSSHHLLEMQNRQWLPIPVTIFNSVPSTKKTPGRDREHGVIAAWAFALVTTDAPVTAGLVDRLSKLRRAAGGARSNGRRDLIDTLPTGPVTLR